MTVDVAIIGAGPAGCAAALTLRAAGLSVAMIDAPKRSEKPTETAAPDLERLVRALGTEAALSACQACFGISSEWGGARPAFQPSIINPFGHAWFVHRAPFDRSLQQAARNAGAAWFHARATNIALDSTSVSVALVDNRTIHAQWLVLATGAPSWPARVTGQTCAHVDRMIAFWAELPARLEDRLLYVEAVERGWWYLCPGAGETAFACFMTDAVSARALKLPRADHWNALFCATSLSRRLGSQAPAASVQAAATGVAALQCASGPRWIAVGDAAVRLDPLGSSGICTALDGARRAGVAIAAALHGDPTAVDQYSGWTGGLLKAFLRQRNQHYALEAGLRSAAFWSARLRQAA